VAAAGDRIRLIGRSDSALVLATVEVVVGDNAAVVKFQTLTL
jgi:hypothetical protein